MSRFDVLEKLVFGILYAVQGEAKRGGTSRVVGESQTQVFEVDSAGVPGSQVFQKILGTFVNLVEHFSDPGGAETGGHDSSGFSPSVSPGVGISFGKNGVNFGIEVDQAIGEVVEVFHADLHREIEVSDHDYRSGEHVTPDVFGSLVVVVGVVENFGEMFQTEDHFDVFPDIGEDSHVGCVVFYEVISATLNYQNCPAENGYGHG